MFSQFLPLTEKQQMVVHERNVKAVRQLAVTHFASTPNKTHS